MDTHAHEDMTKHVKTYLMVFGVLMVLTLTVVFFIFLMFVPLATILDKIVLRYQ